VEFCSSSNEKESVEQKSKIHNMHRERERGREREKEKEKENEKEKEKERETDRQTDRQTEGREGVHCVIWHGLNIN